MPIIQNKGLRGLPGLNTLSDAERLAFMQANANKLSKYKTERQRMKAADAIYNNQQFIKQFGLDEFERYNDGTQQSYDLRNQLLRKKVIGDAIDEAYKPQVKNGQIDNNTGAGKHWDKIQQLSTDAQEKLLNSGWKTPLEMASKKGVYLGDKFFDEGIDILAGESIQRYREDSNQQILDRIYNDDADSRAGAKELAPIISQAYLDTDVTGKDNEDTRKKFVKAITPDYNTGNRGISAYASHYGDGSEDQISSEMEDFTVDEMRQVLAKKAVYDQYLSPDMATTALNNEAMRYIKQHQGSLKRFGLFAKDVGIAAMSYTADKINGINNLLLMADDKINGMPTVFVDESSNIVDTTKHQILRDSKGNLGYKDSDGNMHTVHQQQVARTTLHNMGKREDGSDEAEGVFHLNPVYWTRAEQFGTLDADEQKQYEKIGSSPYKVAYDPNEDSDLVYESFKMMSFGIADAASMLIPFGIGAAGKAISTASKAGKVVQGFGKALNTTGRYLGAQTKIGSTVQGLAGAGGIAYAYQRGAFQETLQQNLANLEEATLNASKNDIYNQYQQNEKYKQQVDALVDAEAAKMKAAYIESNTSEGRSVIDSPELDNMIRAKAQDAILGELVKQKFEERKQSDDYATLQQEAIDGAGDAATQTFLPEAIKYGLVNTIGFRKFWYSNPQSMAKQAAKNFKGLGEVTTEAGNKRMAVTPRFSTMKDKAKAFGKAAGAQFWGGAWTNGTDDMMVDAAERVNEDSFNKYLQAYQSGEPIADVYGLTDGLYSYWKGLQNSMGQRTTYQATAVGGFGGLVSATPNMANIAHLATKEGREAFKNTYQQRPVYEEVDGIKTLKRDENGNPVMEDVNWRENWRERANFFIQNGVLNNYYANKASERELQNHADYINELLDKHEEDFGILSNLVASDIALEESKEKRDQLSSRFVKAIQTIEGLSRLANNSEDPAALSSVITNIKTMIDKAANGELTEEEAANEVAQYCAMHDLERNEENAQIALEHITKNAKDLKEALDVYNKAEEQVQKVEQSLGRSIATPVRENMKLSQAWNTHWNKRLQSMKDEIGDTFNRGDEVSQDDLLSVLGSKQNATKEIITYTIQEKQLEEDLVNKHKDTEKLEKDYLDAQKTLEEAKTPDEQYAAQVALVQAQAKFEDAQQEELFVSDLLEKTKQKKQKTSEALEAAKDVDKVKVLTADEIFSLPAIERAQMMNPENNKDYSKEQQAEIEKLESRLRSEDGDKLQKIQDIAVLTREIARNEDAYNRMAQHPEAAAVQMEKQKKAAADAAYDLINKRNAEILASFTSELTDALKPILAVTQEQRENVAFGILRHYSPKRLDTIKEEHLLPEYDQQIDKAKEWSQLASDVSDEVNNLVAVPAWKQLLNDKISDVMEHSTTKQDLMKNLEGLIDHEGSEQIAQSIEKVMQGLESRGHLRDTLVVENRKQRQQREEAAKQKLEEDKKNEEVAKKAAEEAAAREKVTAESTPKAGEIKTGKEVDLEEIKTEPQYTEKKTEEEKEEFVCPVCGKSLKQDYHKHDITCPQCNSDLSIYRKLYSLSEDEAKELADRLGIGNKKPLWGEMVNDFMEEDAEAGSIDTTDVWDGNKKGILTVSMKKGKGMYDSANSISFSVNDTPTTITVDGNAWELSKDDPNGLSPEHADEQGITKEMPFNVKSIEKINGKWYFNGNFADQNISHYLKVSNSFDLAQAIKQHKTQKEAEVIASGVDTKNPNLIDEGDYVRAESPTIEQQAAEANIEDDVTEEVDDAEEANQSGEQLADENINTLSGTAMTKYEPIPLHRDGILKPKVGKKADDSRNMFNEWLSTFVDKNGVTGINLQDIDDTELSKILKSDPHTKVKFMCTPADHRKYIDGKVGSHLFLVIDYTDDIARIHNKNNGGVIESEGNKYLIIGTVGYGDINSPDLNRREINRARRDNWYNNVFGAGSNNRGLQNGRKQYFEEHPDERFRIFKNKNGEDVTTEIIPNSLVPGYIVKQLESDEYPTYRKVSELLKDPERNPQGLGWGNLKWGIQEILKFLPINESSENLMVPRRGVENAGNVFLFIPAGNGKMAPAYIHPCKYTEMQDGKLLRRVEDLLVKLTAPGNKYNIRLAALNDLLKIFHFKKSGHNILLGKQGINNITLTWKDDSGVEHKNSFMLDSSFDTQKFEEFKAAFAEMNPRVNITAQVLSNEASLIEYDEVGALMTDCAFLRTVGSSFGIYPVDAQGNMVTPAKDSNKQANRTSDYTKRRQQVLYKGQEYYYDADRKEFMSSVNGTVVTPETNENLYESLEYNRRVAVGELLPVKSTQTHDYYLINSGEHPLAIKIAKIGKEVTKSTEEEAQKLINQIADEKARKEHEEREDNAKKALNSEEVNLEGNGEFVVDENTGEMVLTEKPAKTVAEETHTQEKEKPVVDKEQASDAVKAEKPRENIVIPENQAATQDFATLIKNKKYKLRIFQEISNKWEDSPVKFENGAPVRSASKDEIIRFLKGKGVNTEVIGTTDADIEAWIHTEITCK